MYELSAEIREGKVCKSSTNAVRRENKVPAVMYDSKANCTHLAVCKKEVSRLIQKRGTSGLIKLNVRRGDNIESHEVVFKNIQFDVFRSHAIHIDFQEAASDKAIRIKVPLKSVGTPYGVLRQGGVLQQNAQEAELLCLPKDIPDYISVDVSKLNLHDLVRAGDIPGFNFTTPTQSLFSVATSRAARILEAEDSTDKEG